MLKFSQFLLSEGANTGQKVHYQGNVSEHAYHKALLKYSSLRKNGVSHEDALDSITDTKSPAITSAHPDLKNAVSKIGRAATNKIIKNSLQSAKHFIQHIHEHYGEIDHSRPIELTGPMGEKKVREKFGHLTNADIIIPIKAYSKSGPRKIVLHRDKSMVGNSLKYSTTGGATKLRTPSLLSLHEGKTSETGKKTTLGIRDLAIRHLFNNDENHDEIKKFDKLFKKTQQTVGVAPKESIKFLERPGTPERPSIRERIQAAITADSPKGRTPRRIIPASEMAFSKLKQRIRRLKEVKPVKTKGKTIVKLYPDEQQEVDDLYSKLSKSVDYKPYQDYFSHASNLLQRVYDTPSAREDVHSFHKGLMGITEHGNIPTLNVTVLAKPNKPVNTRVVDLNKAYEAHADKNFSVTPIKSGAGGLNIESTEGKLIRLDLDRPGETEKDKSKVTEAGIFKPGKPGVTYYGETSSRKQTTKKLKKSKK